MSNPINNYLFKVIAYKKMFTPEECEKIKHLQSGIDVPVPIYLSDQTKYNPLLHPDTTGFNLNEETKWIFDRLEKILNSANERFFNFEINGFADMRLNNYNSNHSFDWHPDLGASQTSTRKITLVTLLSNKEDYKGGIIEWDGVHEEINQEQGTVVLFPPYIFHQVTPVTEGNRYTLICWAVGPHFR